MKKVSNVKKVMKIKNVSHDIVDILLSIKKGQTDSEKRLSLEIKRGQEDSEKRLSFSVRKGQEDLETKLSHEIKSSQEQLEKRLLIEIKSAQEDSEKRLSLSIKKGQEDLERRLSLEIKNVQLEIKAARAEAKKDNENLAIITARGFAKTVTKDDMVKYVADRTRETNVLIENNNIETIRVFRDDSKMRDGKVTVLNLKVEQQYSELNGRVLVLENTR